MKVLLVDDSSRMRSFFRSEIMALGHDVVEAIDGKDAVQKLFGNNDQIDISIDAVITDLQMPHMNGEEFVRFMDEHGAHTPCLLHTSGSMHFAYKYPFLTLAFKEEAEHVEKFLQSVQERKPEAVH